MFCSLKKFSLLIVMSFALASCENSLENRTQQMDDFTAQEYGSITLQSISKSAKALNTSDISYASVRISGSDISESEEPGIAKTPVSGGKNAQPITIKKIPVGKNRIITVQALDEDGKEIQGVLLRAVTDILPDQNVSVEISNKTTSYGNVIYELKSFFSDLSAPSEETKAKLVELRNAVDETVHPSLFDYKNLTISYKAFSPLQDKSFYVLKTASFTFDYLLNDNFTIHVNDPISKDVHYDKAGCQRTISDIAPGIWTLSIKDSSGTIVEKTEININSGINKKIDHLPHNGIAAIARTSLGYDYLHYWGCKENPSLKTSWPGEKATKTVQADNAEDTSYYVFDFPNVSAISCLLTKKDGSKYYNNGSDIVLSGTGVYCIHSKSIECLTEKNDIPGDFQLSDYSLTAENYETFYYDDDKNKQIIMLINPETWKIPESEKIQSAKIEFNYGINDFGGFKGYSANFREDKSGVWYAIIPYSEIRATNQCGQPSYRIKVNGNDFSCEQKLISKNYNGYVYTKYSSKNAEKSFPVIIYNRQNKAKIISSLENEKTYKHVSDYDLSKEEDQKKIANFRLVPATTTLFRSYHPYNASKTEFGTEPYRMYYVAKLAAKYGIKTDINVGADESVVRKTTTLYDGNSGTTEVSNYLPDYYKEIEKKGSILYLYRSSENPKWSYDAGYSNVLTISDLEENSKFFAKCIGRIVKFVSETEGPYQLHCSIGTDRTGTTCGVLAALCGATYSQIEADYCSSQNMGIYEFRGPGCIRFALEEFLRVTDIEDTTQVPDLQEAVINRLLSYGNVTSAQIEECIRRLGGKLPD